MVVKWFSPQAEGQKSEARNVAPPAARARDPRQKGALSAAARKYGDVFFGRVEPRSPPIHPSRRRENTAPPQDERDLALRGFLRVNGFINLFLIGRSE